MKSVRNLELSHRAEKELAYFNKCEPKLATKISRLMREVLVTPFIGTGKPEPLKHQYGGYWSRRIDKKHRLVYRVEEDTVIILSCRYHYDA